jgi:L-ascorbate metabolism protein UlaG (beta-lactamase superfamily)
MISSDFRDHARGDAMTALTLTLIGGPTMLIEADGFRLITDPTFDAPGEYQLSYVTLTKTSGPALCADRIGPVDAVLISHDQHSDNLDHSGRAFAAKAPRVLTTVAGATRLGGPAEGLRPWDAKQLVNAGGARLTITATPARHGPAGIEPMSGDVIGFVLAFEDALIPPIYITGHRLVRRGGGRRTPLSRGRRRSVRRCRADARAVPSDHGYQ